MKNSSKRIAMLGIYVALAMLMSYIEILIPPLFTAVPGMKMGLPNIIIIFVLYREGFRYALLTSVIRVAAVSLLFGNAVVLVYSLAGALLSVIAMAALKRIDIFSLVGVSVVGGILHNLGQILVAMLLLENLAIGYYMLVLAVSGTIAGALIGFLSSYLIKRLSIK